MDLSTMSYEVADGVAHVRFTNPDGANAVSPTFSRDLRAVTLDEVNAALAEVLTPAAVVAEVGPAD